MIMNWHCRILRPKVDRPKQQCSSENGDRTEVPCLNGSCISVVNIR